MVENLDKKERKIGNLFETLTELKGPFIRAISQSKFALRFHGFDENALDSDF